MRNILIFGMTENPGGVEAFVMNYYRNLDKEKLHLDFLCNTEDKIAYEQELRDGGSRIYHIIQRKKNPILHKMQVKQFFKEHAKEYDVIWINICNLANINYLKLAKKYGIKKRIIHSHNSQNMGSKLNTLRHNQNKKKLYKYATDFWACSKEAANWFYGDKLLKKSIIIKNAIDVDRMTFDDEKRNKIQSEYGLKGNYVIGNVGRLHFQKNQKFILEIFTEYQKKDKESVLVLVGQGEDEQTLKEQAKTLGLNEKVKFVGLQNDIAGWLSAMDLFLFPSKFEGLSIAALEAQANGIPVLASAKVIEEDNKVNDNFCFCSLDKSAEEWADEIEKMKYVKRCGQDKVKDNFKKTGFDIRVEKNKLEEMLLEKDEEV